MQHDIESTDRQIDALLYELCGLTDEEIRIVEAATACRRGDLSAAPDTVSNAGLTESGSDL